MTNKYSSEGYFSKKVRTKKRGFTLIELLAVIIILGVLMIIAIPSVTEYIQNSRKNAYITTATQYISGTRNLVNSSELPMYDTNTTYYVPSSCISLESGGDSPFGELEEAYVAVTYDGSGYDYYWTSRDSANMGILLSSEKSLNVESVESGITSIKTDVGIGNRENILLIKDDCNLANAESVTLGEYIDENGSYDDGTNTTLYGTLKEVAVLDSIKSTYVSSETGIDFNQAPSDVNGKGVYIRNETQNNKYPIYYFRGNVSNNNVIFADFCWKIVRTTDTGGIKMIYNGTPNNGVCANTGDMTKIGNSQYSNSFVDNTYVGYMYGKVGASSYNETHSNESDSVVKTSIDLWYKSNIAGKGYSSYLEDTVWCNDRTVSSGSGVSSEQTTYNASTRLKSNNPEILLTCSNQNDKFTVSSSIGNGKLTYPVALLTADETTLAGHGFNGYSSSSYLYTGQPWWTMTPNYFGTYAVQFYVYSYTNDIDLGNSIGVRPAVSLKPGTKFASGDGTYNSPYVIE